MFRRRCLLRRAAFRFAVATALSASLIGLSVLGPASASTVVAEGTTPLRVDIARAAAAAAAVNLLEASRPDAAGEPHELSTDAPHDHPAEGAHDHAPGDKGLAEALAEPEVNSEPELPPDAMRPLDGPTTGPEAIALYPPNDDLVNPFGRGTQLACQGLMQWLAPRSRGRWHSGLDLVPARGRARGTKLYAPGDGIVLRRRDWHPSWGSYLIAAFRKKDRLYLMGFFHLQARSHKQVPERNMANGETGRITKGQFLGRVGRTGAARGAHLHLDAVRVLDVTGPDQLPRVLWRGRTWTEVIHPADVIEELPRAVYGKRKRPTAGLIVRAPSLGDRASDHS